MKITATALMLAMLASSASAQSGACNDAQKNIHSAAGVESAWLKLEADATVKFTAVYANCLQDFVKNHSCIRGFDWSGNEGDVNRYRVAIQAAVTPRQCCAP